MFTFKRVLWIGCIALLAGTGLTEARPKKAPPVRRAVLTKQQAPLPLDLPVPPASDLPIGTAAPDAILPVQVLDGIVAGKPRREDFFLRSNGFVYLVRPHSPGLLKTIAGGDGVRVYGTVNGLNVSNANLRVLQSRASARWDDYAPELPEE